jgi:hypothetical protein
MPKQPKQATAIQLAIELQQLRPTYRRAFLRLILALIAAKGRHREIRQ